MPKRFLNIEYSGTKTRINATDIEDLSEVQDAVKAKYGPAMADVGAAQLQFYDQLNQHIRTWSLFSALPPEYNQEEGLFLVVHGPKQESVSGSRPPKRARSASSVASRASNGTELNQDSFRERILARDTNGCVLTGKDELDCQACHIVPWILL